MESNVPGNDPKSIWQNQPTENRNMTLRLIQQRSRELRARTRKKLLGTMVAPLAVILLYILTMRLFPAFGQMLHVPMALALTWSLTGLFFLSRGMWPVVNLGDAGVIAGLQACRREVEKQRDLVRRGLLWTVGPILMAIGTFVVVLAVAGRGPRLIPNGLPFLVLLGVWIVATLVIRFREQQSLQREMEELDEIEREGRG